MMRSMIAYRHVASVACVLAATYIPVALGQINKCRTKEGRTVYQDEPCAVEDKASSLKKPGAGPSMPAASGGSASASSRKPEEDKALGNLVVIAGVTKTCKEMTGRYASLDEMRKGCVGANMSMGLHKDNDPSNDPNYDYRMSARTDGFELSIAPRRSGLTGYFTDGISVFENSSGAASSQSKKLGPLPF